MTSRLAQPRKSSLKSLELIGRAELPRVARMSDAARQAEKLAREHGLEYLSREGYEKLAKMLEQYRLTVMADTGYSSIIK